MLYTAAFVVATVVGFALSRLLRRPTSTAQAASVARQVSGTLGGRRGLSAPELQRACFSEMVRHVRVNRRGRTSAPSRYIFRLHPADLAVVDEARRWFTEGLVQAMDDAAAQNGWILPGPVHVDFRADPSRRPGAPLAVPVDEAPAEADPEPPARGRTDEGALALVRTDTGEQIPLHGQVVTVGRSTENTITSLDERISRAHARIERTGGSWVVVDLGSANGTRVDGTRVAPGRPTAITAGMVVAVGPLDLTVVAAGPRPEGQPGGTRALDAAERTRISAEVLGTPSQGRQS